MCPRVTSVTVSPRAMKGAGPGQPPAHRPAPVPFPPRCWLPAARRRPRLGSAASVPVTGRAAPVSLGSHSTWGSPCGAGRGRGRSGWPSLQKPCAARRPGRAPAAGTRPRRVQWEAQAGLRSHGSLSASAGSHDTHCHLSESPSLPHHRLLTRISGSSACRKRRQTSGRGISHIWAAAPRGRESTNFAGPAQRAPELTAAAPGTLGRGSGSYRAVPGSTQHLTENRTRAWLSSTCHRM